MCLLGHLLHLNIEGIIVDLVPKTHVVEVLGGVKYALSCSSKAFELSFEVSVLLSFIKSMRVESGGGLSCLR